ncbi:MAG: ATPase [Rickettsiaceae bacterium]|jgi:Cu2+-exporting ATPase|nr:ATPase [Rickettsiaceae bacterium]
MKNYCLHCGLENKTQSHSEQDYFCCKGCEAAYKIINNLGLENYYKTRLLDRKARPLKPEENNQIDIVEFANQENDGWSIDLMVDGLQCASCVWLIENILRKQTEVKKARINMTSKRLRLEWSGDRNIGNDLVGMVFDLGYRLVPFDAEFLKSEEKKYDSKILKALSVAGFAAGNVMLVSIALWANDSAQMGVATRNLLHWISSLIALPAIIYSGRIFIISAFNSIKAGRMNMDVPIAVAIILASITSVFEAITKGEHAYFDSVIMLIFFLLIGRYLDFSARKKAFSITADLILLAGTSATVIIDGKHKIIAGKNLEPGMILNVAMGERIAADGVIIQGEGEIDTSIITGESLPKKIKTGEEVFAGMINLGNAIQVKITKTKEQTLLSTIVKMVEQIETSKNYYTKIADIVAKYYTPIIHLIAFITFMVGCFLLGIGWHKSLLNAAAVLIITCPCALALAVPVTQIVAASRLLKQGILLKNGDALEKLIKTEAMVFDKTGTLTIGKPQLIKDQTIDDKTTQIAASMAAKSKHVLSRALAENFQGKLLDFEVKEIPGMGLVGNYQGEEVRLGNKRHLGINFEENIDNQLPQIYLNYQNKITAFTFQDQIRIDAAEVINKLQSYNKNIILLSGDKKSVVEKTAKELGIKEFYFEKTPDQKLEILKKLKEKKKNILMVGDGINDAPALMMADISISPSSASDISKNIADVIFQGEKLWPVLEVMNVAKKSNRIMKENLGFALVYNLIAIPFAIAGHVVPLFAALAMSSSSIIVVINALRVKRS